MFVILKEFCESFRNFIIETKETKTPKTQPHDNFKSKTTTTTEKRKKMEKRTIFKKKSLFIYYREYTIRIHKSKHFSVCFCHRFVY